MKIVKAPHPALRQKAKRVEKVDKKISQLVAGLGETLVNHGQARGVGLAAPQVDKNWRIFATYLTPEDGERGLPDVGMAQIYINPVIVKHHPKPSFGPNKKEATLEGCLSIPGFFGPVPRYPWIELEYQTLENGKLLNHTGRFSWYQARVMQHEIDHLDGILFTDYSLSYDLPVYTDDKDGKKLVELENRRILEVF